MPNPEQRFAICELCPRAVEYSLLAKQIDHPVEEKRRRASVDAHAAKRLQDFCEEDERNLPREYRGRTAKEAAAREVKQRAWDAWLAGIQGLADQANEIECSAEDGQCPRYDFVLPGVVACQQMLERTLRPEPESGQGGE